MLDFLLQIFHPRGRYSAIASFAVLSPLVIALIVRFFAEVPPEVAYVVWIIPAWIIAKLVFLFAWGIAGGTLPVGPRSDR